MVKTWSKYANELPNIVFNQMFTCFSCAGQNVASVMDTFRENCPLVKKHKMQKKHKKETHRIENKYKKKMVQEEEEKIKCQQIYNHVEYYLF